MPLTLTEQLKLYLVIGPADCNHSVEKMLCIIEAAVKGGVRSVQLRDKNNDEHHIRDSANRILALLHQLEKEINENILFVINDYAHIAHELKVGLHIGQSDISYEKARSFMGPDAIIGLSIENMKQAEVRSTQHGIASDFIDINYFGVGPIFPAVHHSKLDASPPIGVSELEKITNILSFAPCVAIGGIKESNVETLAPTGVAGIAVISALTQAKDPKAAAKFLLEKLSRASFGSTAPPSLNIYRCKL